VGGALAIQARMNRTPRSNPTLADVWRCTRRAAM
jgi:hypothetical protein